MRVSQPLLAGVFALVVSACGAEVTTAPNDALQLNVVDGNGTSRLRGKVWTPSGTGRRIVTVDAQQNPEGHVKGFYRIDLTAAGVFFKVAATCVATEGNTAWVAGIISETNSAVITVGTVSYFYAIDSAWPGEGAGAGPDVISASRINDAAGEDLAFCTDRPLLLPRLAGVEGDLRVW